MHANLIDRLLMKALSFATTKPAMNMLDAGVVSIGFDDAPKSAVTTGADILAKHNIAASFYLNGHHAGISFEDRPQFESQDVLELHAAGHEIGCHGYRHLYMRGAGKDARTKDWQDNLDWARGLLGPDFQFDSFAWPYGAYDLAALKQAGERFSACRGVYKGLNDANMDLANLKTLPLEARRIGQGWLNHSLAPMLEKARNEKAWLILFSHDVADDCTPYGVTPAMLNQTVKMIADAGLKIAPMGTIGRQLSGQS